jgi:hypothetical protein
MSNVRSFLSVDAYLSMPTTSYSPFRTFTSLLPSRPLLPVTTILRVGVPAAPIVLRMPRDNKLELRHYVLWSYESDD